MDLCKLRRRPAEVPEKEVVDLLGVGGFAPVPPVAQQAEGLPS